MLSKLLKQVENRIVLLCHVEGKATKQFSAFQVTVPKTNRGDLNQFVTAYIEKLTQAGAIVSFAEGSLQRVLVDGRTKPSPTEGVRTFYFTCEVEATHRHDNRLIIPSEFRPNSRRQQELKHAINQAASMRASTSMRVEETQPNSTAA